MSLKLRQCPQCTKLVEQDANGFLLDHDGKSRQDWVGAWGIRCRGSRSGPKPTLPEMRPAVSMHTAYLVAWLSPDARTVLNYGIYSEAEPTHDFRRARPATLERAQGFTYQEARHNLLTLILTTPGWDHIAEACR